LRFILPTDSAFDAGTEACTTMTLEKILQSQGFGSRKLCRDMILDCRVTVNGAVCSDPGAAFAAGDLRFTVDDDEWRYRERVYLAMNKPACYECSHQPQHHSSVFSLLPPQLVLRGVQCVGRLDQDTTGLLLLSDDGGFIHTYSAPKKKVNKVYRVTTKHPVCDTMLDALLAGVLLHGEPAPLAAVACGKIGEQVLDLSIAEGKYHQVKRMIAAAGNRVERLHRLAIGGYRLAPDLPSGLWVWLEPDDLARLRRTEL
jgi:16S rRNA pseudouridine516 synthase